MDKTIHKIIAVIALGVLLLFGPIVQRIKASQNGFFEIPTLYWYVFSIWAVLIILTRLIIKQRN